MNVIYEVFNSLSMYEEMPRMYGYQGKLGQWKLENMAAVVKEVKENKMPLSAAANNLMFLETG
jgi:hypothetical protein